MNKSLFAFAFCTILFSSIGMASKPIPVKQTSSPLPPTQDSIFKQVFHATQGEYDLYIISTCMIGEISFGYFDPNDIYLGELTLGKGNNSLAMLEQEFIFTKNGRTIKQFFSPVRKRNATTASGHTYSFLEIPLVETCVMLLNDKFYYRFTASDFQRLAPNVALFYSIDGELLVHFYQGDLKIVEIDNHTEIFADYVVDYRVGNYAYNYFANAAIVQCFEFNDLGYAESHPPYKTDSK